MPVLELRRVVKHFGAIHALNEVDLALERRRGAGPDGRQRRRQVDPGQGHRRQLSAHLRRDRPRRRAAQHFHKPVEAREKGIEVVYQDLALCNNLSAAANVFLGREIKRGDRARFAGSTTRRWPSAPASCSASSSPRRGRATSCARCRAGSARRSPSPARGCRRPRCVLMDEPTAAISRAPGGRGAGPDPPAAGRRHGDHPHQPPHAGRVRRLRPGHGDAARQQGRRQADHGDEPGRSDRPDHRARSMRLDEAAMATRSRRIADVAIESRCCDIQQHNVLQRFTASQAFWVTVALVVDLHRDELCCSRRRSPPPTISTTPRAISPSSASWRSA